MWSPVLRPSHPWHPQELPPYNGFGSLEDSLQNCLSLVPEPPKKDLLKLLGNDGKILRYAARMVRSTVLCAGKQSNVNKPSPHEVHGGRGYLWLSVIYCLLLIGYIFGSCQHKSGSDLQHTITPPTVDSNASFLAPLIIIAIITRKLKTKAGSELFGSIRAYWKVTVIFN